VERHGSRFRVRHQAPGTQDASGLSDRGHQVGSGDGGVEVDRSLQDVLDEVLSPDDVGSRLPGLARLFAGREGADANRASGAVRKRDRSADHLVGLPRVDAEVERELHRFVELRLRERLQELHRFAGEVLLVRLDRLGGGLVTLAAHRRTSIPMLRAVPEMILAAASTSFALRSAILRSAISWTWAIVTIATLFLFGSP